MKDMSTKPRRPDMTQYFKARISQHVYGMMSTTAARLPHDVARVSGDVTDRLIRVTKRDGSIHEYAGGRYAERKRNGCYAPLMPKYLGLYVEDL